MDRRRRFTRWLVGAAILAAAEFAGVAAIEFALTVPAQAQRSDSGFPFLSRQRPSRGGGFFQQLFGPSDQRRSDGEPSQPVDYSRAPAARKPDPKAEPVTPTTSIVVLGDGMADWLAYGLEDAFSDAPEIGIVRKVKTHSGLLRYEARSDLDWWHVARDLLAQEKPNYVVMMLGVGDRQNIRERDLAKEAEKADETDQKKNEGEASPQPAIVAPEPKQTKKANGIVEFRSDQWEKIYSRRIDETVAALKSKGVPVFWVGLPSIRGTRSTADVVYLNDLYRARAEKAGAVYIDVWDGFVDEAGKYATYGPDYEGQMRRLRAGDGVYFTKYGARKLAHYVEREVRRYMANRGPIALPSGPMGPVPADGKSVVRPLVGPVVPLTTTTGLSDELLGGAGSGPARADAIATGVLVKGEPVAAPAGRADDFIWPRGSEAAPALPVAAKPAAASASASAVAPAAVTAKPAPAIVKPEPPAAVKPKPTEAAIAPAATTTRDVVAKPKPVEPTEAKPARPVETKPAEIRPPKPAESKPARAVDNRPRPPQNVAPRPQQNAAQRPPQPVRRLPDDGLFGRNGPFGWIQR